MHTSVMDVMAGFVDGVLEAAAQAAGLELTAVHVYDPEEDEAADAADDLRC